MTRLGSRPDYESKSDERPNEGDLDVASAKLWQKRGHADNDIHSDTGQLHKDLKAAKSPLRNHSSTMFPISSTYTADSPIIDMGLTTASKTIGVHAFALQLSHDLGLKIDPENETPLNDSFIEFCWRLYEEGADHLQWAIAAELLEQKQ